MKSFALLASILVVSGSIHGQQPAPSLSGRDVPTAGTDASGLGAGGFGRGPAAAQSGDAAQADLYGAGLLREEGEGDLASAEAAYRLAIQQFDRQREGAANAIFRLGEVYRKMGRIEEAKVQYARILREFPDMVRLTELSHARLFGEDGRTRATSQIAPAQPTPGTGTAAGRGAEQDPTEYERMMMERYGIVPGARSQVGGSAQAGPNAELMRNRYGTPPGQARSTTIAPVDPSRINCANRMKQLALAALIYASDHEGAHPTTVRAMQQEIGESPEALICPSDNERQRAASWGDFDPAVHMTYEYQGESLRETDVNKVLFRCPIHGHVARADGSVMLGPDPSRPVAAGVDSILLQRYGLGAGTGTAAPDDPAVRIVNSIINNLRRIDGAKQQWALEKRQAQSARPTANDIADYLRAGFPAPIAGERYEINAVGESPVAVLTQPIGNRQAGDVITMEVPDQALPVRPTEPVRIHVREDGSIEVDGERVEASALSQRLLGITKRPRPARRAGEEPSPLVVLMAEDRSPWESLLTVISEAHAADLRPLEIEGPARPRFQEEAVRWAEEIARLGKTIASLSQEAVRLQMNEQILTNELREAEERVGPAIQRFDASYSDAERLPGMISQDERYQKLRAEYETAVLDGDEETGKRAKARLEKWVELIYRPELIAEYEFAEKNLRQIRSRYEQLQARLQDVRSQLNQLQEQLSRLHQRQNALKAVVPDLEAAP
jgi:biopolymer transport protein ExbD